MGVKHWAIASSSSGGLLSKFWPELSPETKSKCLGLFSDRACPALEVAEKLGLKATQFGRKTDFENKLLAQLRLVKSESALLFLCGYFGILSEEFLEQCPWPIVNTHPSLLPAFPGLDQKVHEEAFAQSLTSGFTVHLVNEKLDGGPLLFQESCSTADCKSPQELREKVRALEAASMAAIVEKLMSLKLASSDRHLATRSLRSKGLES